MIPETYSNGIRFSSDAMDCSIPIAIDPRNFCAYNCRYCFSENLMRNPDRNPAMVENKQFSIKRLEKFLHRDLKDAVSQAMYPLLDSGCPVQLGAMGEPFDEVELQTGWALQAIPLFIKYKIPVRISTKGARVLQRPEYLKLFESSPDQFWFAFSIICNDDNLIAKIDRGAPTTSQRLKAMKALTNLGCKASLRFRPFLPGVSDIYPGGPKNAWEVLIDRSHEAGARAISFEWIFIDRSLTPQQKVDFNQMYEIMGDPNFGKYWRKSSHRKESCLRGNRFYKRAMTMKIREKTLGLGWNFGISDPHFKEYNSTSSCCGFPDTGDKWFSNFSHEQLTAVLVEAKRRYEAGTPKQITYNDWKPGWAENVRVADCVNLGNWHEHRKKKYQTMADAFHNKWNKPDHPRGPYIYFDKVLVPVGTDEASGDLIYEYRPW
jgi:DNA repair photolyase